MEKEYEFDITIELGYCGESMNRLKNLAELKKTLKKATEDFLEKQENIGSYYELSSIDVEVNYEEMN